MYWKIPNPMDDRRQTERPEWLWLRPFAAPAARAQPSPLRLPLTRPPWGEKGSPWGCLLFLVAAGDFFLTCAPSEHFADRSASQTTPCRESCKFPLSFITLAQRLMWFVSKLFEPRSLDRGGCVTY
jgi:hypothetical protein